MGRRVLKADLDVQFQLTITKYASAFYKKRKIITFRKMH